MTRCTKKIREKRQNNTFQHKTTRLDKKETQLMWTVKAHGQDDTGGILARMMLNMPTTKRHAKRTAKLMNQVYRTENYYAERIDK